MRWLFGNTAVPLAEEILERLLNGAVAHVPVLWLYEAIAVTTKAQRAGTVTEKDAHGLIEDLRSLEIVVDHDGAEMVLFEVRRLAVEYRLSGYDAAYLELALRKGLPLATLDEELRRAAVSAGVVLAG